MRIYKNCSHSVKTFHGVTFKPGEVKEVPGVINHDSFIKMEKLPDITPSKEPKVKSSINKTTKNSTEIKVDKEKEEKKEGIE